MVFQLVLVACLVVQMGLAYTNMKRSGDDMPERRLWLIIGNTNMAAALVGLIVIIGDQK